MHSRINTTNHIDTTSRINTLNRINMVNRFNTPNPSVYTRHIGCGAVTGIASIQQGFTIHGLITFIRTTMAGITAVVDMSAVDFEAAAEATPVVVTVGTDNGGMAVNNARAG